MSQSHGQFRFQRGNEVSARGDRRIFAPLPAYQHDARRKHIGSQTEDPVTQLCPERPSPADGKTRADHRVSPRDLFGDLLESGRFTDDRRHDGVDFARRRALALRRPHIFLGWLRCAVHDRFEGRFRDGVHVADVSDLMRRMVKERLLTFEGTPLFPERVAHTIPYRLSDEEAHLYNEVSNYVREEFNRAEALENNQRAGAVGFALTLLQRRLASSPEAIYQSLRRRRERLESRLRELELLRRGGQAVVRIGLSRDIELDADEFEDLEDAPAGEQEQAAEEILDQATAARTIAELKTEIGTLRHVEQLALRVRRSGTDTKWRQLAGLLGEILPSDGTAPSTAQAGHAQAGHAQKLVIFTEHRDTLAYLRGRIGTVLGREQAIVVIHGGLGREERSKAQEAFRHDPGVQILLATDAAGEGINLQRAHLMVNYDLP